MADRYPEHEVVLRSVYCQAQILTKWEGFNPPRYIAVHSLDERRPGEWICEQRMGAWMDVDLSRVASEASANHAGDSNYLSRFPVEARPYCDRAYQDGHEDGRNDSEAGLAPEFVAKCEGDGLEPDVVLKQFVADLCALDGSRGSDERDFAYQWFERSFAWRRA